MPEIFVYETLLNRDTFKGVVGHKVKEFPDTLSGYEEVDTGKGYETIEPKVGSKVFGAVVDVSDDDLKKLDSWESRYKRIKVILEDGTPAWTYQMKPAEENKNLKAFFSKQ